MMGFKIIPLINRHPSSVNYTEFMAKECAKKPKIKWSGIQEPSTQATLNRKPSDDEAHFFRELPPESEWKRDHEARGNWSLDTISHAQSVKSRDHNTLGDAVSFGATSVSDDRREKAISAFTCSPPADLKTETKTRIDALIGLMSEPATEKIVKPKKTWFQKVKSLFIAPIGKSYEDHYPGAIEAWTKAFGGKKK